jgi:hypothetical protein
MSLCKHGTLKTVTITPKPFDVKIDACIADEIVWLNAQGVYTANSCCGHGDQKPTALIHVNHGSIKRARELGYDPKPYTPMLWEIELKSGGDRN